MCVGGGGQERKRGVVVGRGGSRRRGGAEWDSDAQRNAAQHIAWRFKVKAGRTFNMEQDTAAACAHTFIPLNPNTTAKRLHTLHTHPPCLTV